MTSKTSAWTGEYRRVQRRRGVRNLVANAGDVFAVRGGLLQRHAVAVADEHISPRMRARERHLHALVGGVDEARHAAGGRLLRQQGPGFVGAPQLERERPDRYRPEDGKAQLEQRLEPIELERVARRHQIGDDAAQIVEEDIRQHESIMQRRAPAAELSAVRMAPEAADQAEDEQRLQAPRGASPARSRTR